MAPGAKTAIMPSAALQVTTFSVLDAPASLRPRAMRSLTGHWMEVETTASTLESGEEHRTSTKPNAYQSEHVLSPNKNDDDWQDTPSTGQPCALNFRRRSPWYHCYTKTPDSTYAHTGDGADHNLHNACKSNTKARVNRVHPSHTAREVDENHEVSHVQQHADRRYCHMMSIKLAMSELVFVTGGMHTWMARSFDCALIVSACPLPSITLFTS